MRIRATITVALAALAVAVLMAMPALAAKGGKDRPFKQKGTSTGTITYSSFECIAEVPADDCIISYKWGGPVIGTHIGKGSVESVNDGLGGPENKHHHGCQWRHDQLHGD